MPILRAMLSQHRRLIAAAGLAAFATAVFAAWIGLGVGGETLAGDVDSLGTAVAALVAAVLCARAARCHEGRERRFWWLLAAACGSWTLGEVGWSVYDVVLRREVPTPSWADIGYLGGTPLAIAALLSHPAMRGHGTATARSALDALAVATALLFLSWALVLGPLWKSTDVGTAGGLVTLAYPFGDVVLVVFSVLVVRRMSGAGRVGLWLLLGGLVAMALTDSVYAYLVGVTEYAPGNLIDAGWVAAYLTVAAAAFCADSRGVLAERSGAPARPLAPVVVPLLAMIAALTVIGIEAQLGHRPDPTGLIMACSLIALIFVRQALLVIDLMAPHEENDGSVMERLYAALLEPERARP